MNTPYGNPLGFHDMSAPGDAFNAFNAYNFNPELIESVSNIY